MRKFPFVYILIFASACNLFAQNSIKDIKEVFHIDNDITLYSIAPNIYVHESFAIVGSWGRVGANGLVIISNGKAMLIDTPWNDSLTLALTGWLSANLHATVEKAVGCHFHDDCIGGFAVLNKHGVETIYSSTNKAICAKSGLPAAKTTFADSLTVDLNGLAIQLYYPGGGHSKDNIVAYIPSQNVLFGGCLIKEIASQSMGNTSDADIPAWPVSVKRVMAQFPLAAIVVPGHGKVGGKELLQHTVEIVGGK